MRAVKIGLNSVVLIFLLLAVWSCQSGPKVEEKKRPVTSDKPNPNAIKMPDFKFTTTEGKEFTPKDLKKQTTVLFFFSSLCRHCRDNAQELIKRADELKDVQVIFFSTEPIKAIKDFRVDNKLESYANYQFMHIENKAVFDTFGSLQVPSTLIFNKHHEMVQKIIGNTFFDFVMSNIPA
ncbi:MAG TPA: hypothetical protein DCS93_11035 [Microscillaceae bacterium]|nr:hypothetical protein [Microscillaceae bacterium]